jgi:hypothetical protein
MFGQRRAETNRPDDASEAEATSRGGSDGERGLIDVAYPMQQVSMRWHTFDGGEVGVGGQIQAVDGWLVDVGFDRTAPSDSPLHSDDQIWIVRGFFSEIGERHRLDVIRFVLRDRLRKARLSSLSASPAARSRAIGYA